MPNIISLFFRPHILKATTLNQLFDRTELLSTIPLRNCCKKISYNKSSSSSIVNNMDMGHFTISYVTTPSEEVAKQLSRVLLSSRLAACVNVIYGVTSIYEWQGKVKEDSECLMIIKSHSSKTKSLIDAVRTNHPYDCPEIITSRIEDGSQEYLRWLQDTLNKPFMDGNNYFPL